MRRVLVDTNLLLDDCTVLYKLTKEYDQIVIPITVLKELDKHKVNPDLSYSARLAITTIKEFKLQYPSKLNIVVNEDDISSNDSRIIRAAQDIGACVATKDISMSIISESMGVETRLFGNLANGKYQPYLYLSTEQLPSSFIYKQLYTLGDYKLIFDDIFTPAGYTNQEWFFLFITKDNTNVAIYANNVVTNTLERIDNIEKYRFITNKDKGIELKAKDHYQICAIFALTNAPNVLITGKWGSGKSLLATASCIATNDGKTFISRAPIGINPKFNLGYTPGSIDDKMMEWFAGFISSLYFLYANTRGQSSKGVDYDYVRDSKFKDYFSTMPINAVQGLSLLEGDVLCVDECQLLDIDTISSVLSRGTTESKIILLGDLNQTYSSVKPSNSGLLKLLRALPHTHMAYVDLKTSFRSPLLEIADVLQDKTF